MAIGAPISQKWRIILGLISLLALILSYSVLSYSKHADDPKNKTVPNLEQLVEGVENSFVVQEFTEEQWFIADAGASASRLMWGLGISLFLAFFIGVHMGAWTPVEAFLMPIMQLSSKMIPTAMIAIIFALAGIGDQMHITVIVFGITPGMTIGIFQAMKDVPKEMINKAYTLGASQIQIIWKVMVPQTIPKVIDVIRASIGPALVFLIAAEMISSELGFGFRIKRESRLVNLNLAYFYVMVLAAFGFFTDWSLKRLSKYACPWFIKGGR